MPEGGCRGRKLYGRAHRSGETKGFSEVTAKYLAQWETNLGDAYCGPIQNKQIAEISTDDILNLLTPDWQSSSRRLGGSAGAVLRDVRPMRTQLNLRSPISPACLALRRGQLLARRPAGRGGLIRGRRYSGPGQIGAGPFPWRSCAEHPRSLCSKRSEPSPAISLGFARTKGSQRQSIRRLCLAPAPAEL